MNVIVTGGSRGIGREIVLHLARLGYQVVLNYHTSGKQAQEIKELLQTQGYTIELFKADVSKIEQVKELIKFSLEKLGTIDVLINNAGITQFKMFIDIQVTDWDHMINTNLNSVFYVTKEAVQNMIHRKQGCIINISSIWGSIGASCETHYAVSKAGVDAITKSLAKELGPSNIRVNSIAPGIIDTGMNEHLTKQEREAICEEIPLQKIGESSDIAKCIEWLIKDSYTTGQIISINGGWSIT